MAQVDEDGYFVSLRSAVLPGVPFPIPRNGQEVMWNHRLHYMGRAVLYKYEGWLVDSAGRVEKFNRKYGRKSPEKADSQA